MTLPTESRTERWLVAAGSAVQSAWPPFALQKLVADLAGRRTAPGRASTSHRISLDVPITGLRTAPGRAGARTEPAR